MSELEGEEGRKGGGMTVYVVTHGERFEGGRVIGVYSHYAKAKAAALSVESHYAVGWEPSKGSQDTWINGCEFVTVEKWEVDEEQLEEAG